MTDEVKMACRFCIVTGAAIAAVLWSVSVQVHAARMDRCFVALDHVEEAVEHGLVVAPYKRAVLDACDGIGM